LRVAACGVHLIKLVEAALQGAQHAHRRRAPANGARIGEIRPRGIPAQNCVKNLVHGRVRSGGGDGGDVGARHGAV